MLYQRGARSVMQPADGIGNQGSTVDGTAVLTPKVAGPELAGAGSLRRSVKFTAQPSPVTMLCSPERMMLISGERLPSFRWGHMSVRLECSVSATHHLLNHA